MFINPHPDLAVVCILACLWLRVVFPLVEVVIEVHIDVVNHDQSKEHHVIHEPDHVKIESVRFPLELDQVLHCLGLENGPFADLGQLVHHVILVVHPGLLDEAVLVWLHLEVPSHVWQQVDGVVDLKDPTRVSLSLGLLGGPLEGNLGEGRKVVLSYAENAVAVWPDHSLFVGVSRWPLVIIKGEEEHVTVQQRGQRDTFCDDLWEVVAEEEGADVVILVLDNVVDDCSYSPVLIGFKSKIKNVSVVVLLIFLGSLIELIPIEYRVLAREELFEFVTEQAHH